VVDTLLMTMELCHGLHLCDFLFTPIGPFSCRADWAKGWFL
jgi:hypothetical protein